MFTEDVGTIFRRQAAGSGRGHFAERFAESGDREAGIDDLAGQPLVMTPCSRLIYAEPGDDILSAAQKMIDYEVDCLPVVDVIHDGAERRFSDARTDIQTNMARLLVDIGRGDRSEGMKVPTIYVLSDSLGETAEKVARATISQFDKEEIDVVRIPYIPFGGANGRSGTRCQSERRHHLPYDRGRRIAGTFEEIAAREQVVSVDILGACCRRCGRSLLRSRA